mgnify:CR=1 FL=1
MTARWSKTPPTVPGWYWARHAGDEPCIVRLFDHGAIDDAAIDSARGVDWAGPIAMPTVAVGDVTSLDGGGRRICQVCGRDDAQCWYLSIAEEVGRVYYDVIECPCGAVVTILAAF